jgi:farnesyl-diphosphate farnesyltransferase
MCLAHLFPKARLDGQALLANGIRFGKGLQLVNILRDLPTDLRQGRCYLPAGELSLHDLKPADLLECAREATLRPIYNTWLDRAEAHLLAGWDYTNSLPWASVRVRLACAWPILIGLETLRLLRSKNVLDPQLRIKVHRPWVRQIIVRSILLYPRKGAWKGLARRENDPLRLKAIASSRVLP